MVELEAEFAEEVHPKRHEPGRPDRQLAAGQPREGRIGDVDVGPLGEDRARVRTGQDQHAILCRHLVDPHAAVLRKQLRQDV